MEQLTFEWDTGAMAREAARFAARVIGAQDSYISHGEIQTGLSLDGRNWIEGLEERYAADFADPRDREMLIARDAKRQIVGIGIIHWNPHQPNPYAVIEDMAVDPEMRGAGIGRQLLERLLTRIEEKGGAWVFLESGLENHRAHSFFEAHGFREISHVFARKLDPPQR